jgi:hypothetical protein
VDRYDEMCKNIFGAKQWFQFVRSSRFDHTKLENEIQKLLASRPEYGVRLPAVGLDEDKHCKTFVVAVSAKKQEPHIYRSYSIEHKAYYGHELHHC